MEIIELQKGSQTIAVSVAQRKTGKSQSELNQTQEKENDPGTISKEIQKFQNQLQFPEEALEQGLESQCEWRIRISESGKAENIENLVPCRYKIFEKEFLKSIGNWKFALEPGQVVRVPVSFRIQER